MTVKELIEKLRQFPEDYTVISSGNEDNYEPMPYLGQQDYSIAYWDDDSKLQTIPANTPYVEL